MGRAAATVSTTQSLGVRCSVGSETTGCTAAVSSIVYHAFLQHRHSLLARRGRLPCRDVLNDEFIELVQEREDRVHEAGALGTSCMVPRIARDGGAPRA
jgi:hypothetical protein